MSQPHSNCPACTDMLKQSIQRNPLGYQTLARAQPGAVLKLCPACKATSKVHGADSPELETVGGLPGVDLTDRQKEAMRRHRKMERIAEVSLFVLIVGVVLHWMMGSSTKSRAEA